MSFKSGNEGNVLWLVSCLRDVAAGSQPVDRLRRRPRCSRRPLRRLGASRHLRRTLLPVRATVSLGNDTGMDVQTSVEHPRQPPSCAHVVAMAPALMMILTIGTSAQLHAEIILFCWSTESS